MYFYREPPPTDLFLAGGGIFTASYQTTSEFWFKSPINWPSFSSENGQGGLNYSWYFSGGSGASPHSARYLDTTLQNSAFVIPFNQPKNIRVEGTLKIDVANGAVVSLVAKNNSNYGFNVPYEFGLVNTPGSMTASIIFSAQNSTPPFNRRIIDLGSVLTGSEITLRMDLYCINSTTDVVKLYRNSGGTWTQLGSNITLTPGNGLYTAGTNYYQGFYGKPTFYSPEYLVGSIKDVSITVANSTLPT